MSAAHLSNWNTYQAAWSALPADRRREMVRQSVDEACVYTDPTSVSEGHEELMAKMDATQRNSPGATFRNDTWQEHHDQAISHWTMFNAHHEPIFIGTSWARIGTDGRFTHMTGFFEPVA